MWAAGRGSRADIYGKRKRIVVSPRDPGIRQLSSVWLIFVEASLLPVIPGGGAGEGRHIPRTWGVGVGSVSAPATLCLIEASRQVKRTFCFPLLLSRCLVSREMGTMSSTLPKALNKTAEVCTVYKYTLCARMRVCTRWLQAFQRQVIATFPVVSEDILCPFGRAYGAPNDSQTRRLPSVHFGKINGDYFGSCSWQFIWKCKPRGQRWQTGEITHSLGPPGQRWAN